MLGVELVATEETMDGLPGEGVQIDGGPDNPPPCVYARDEER